MAEARITEAELAMALDGLLIHLGDKAADHAHTQGYCPWPKALAERIFARFAELKHDPWAGTDDDPQADDHVVDAHICCEHNLESRAAWELRQADQIVTMLGRLPERHVKRVLRWAWDYLTDGDEPPF